MILDPNDLVYDPGEESSEESSEDSEHSEMPAIRSHQGRAAKWFLSNLSPVVDINQIKHLFNQIRLGVIELFLVESYSTS